MRKKDRKKERKRERKKGGRRTEKERYGNRQIELKKRRMEGGPNETLQNI